MRAAYTVFREGKEPERILAAVSPMRGSHDSFYAQLVRVLMLTSSAATYWPPITNVSDY